MIQRPTDQEYAPFYQTYVSLVPEDDIVDVLQRQADELRSLAAWIPPDRHGHRYAPEKWSVREVFGHLGDGERVFGYRASCISRGEQAPLPRFDENAYVANAGFDRARLDDLVDEFLHLRAANLASLKRLNRAAWERVGTASERAISVRALAYIMAGHVRHHLAILRDRYGIDPLATRRPSA
jgi:hypothetical protein